MYVNHIYARYPKKSEKDTGRPETELQIVVSPRCGAQTTKPGSSTRQQVFFNCDQSLQLLFIFPMFMSKD